LCLQLEVVPPELLDFLSQEESDKDVTKEMMERLGDPLVAQKGSTADEFVKYAIPHGVGGTHYACDHDSCMEIEPAEKGAAGMKATTVTALFDMAKVRDRDTMLCNSSRRERSLYGEPSGEFRWRLG
jgi:hypothetical protein